MTPADRARRERVAQGLPEQITDQDALDQIAAILLDAAEHRAEEGGADAVA
jgi:hypothetical protein